MDEKPARVEIDVKYVAHLARLSLTPDEEQLMSAQLGHVLEYIEKLKEVDISGVEPTAHAFPLVNVTRPDETRPSMSHEDALKNAPAHANGLFIVPKIVASDPREPACWLVTFHGLWGDHSVEAGLPGGRLLICEPEIAGRDFCDVPE